ncbi:polyprenyl synthetase family protein [Rhodovibrionaceae bacterium A322]
MPQSQSLLPQQPLEDGGPETASAFSAALTATAAEVEAELDLLLPKVSTPRGRVLSAMRHAALGGGKRLRPFLLIQTAALFDVPRARALRAAAAFEMLHCYSLVHDDLPAMDDSDLRRGRPTVHKAFDEATAVLAGDGLLTEAFAVLSQEAVHPDPAVRGQLIAGLAEAAGPAGMVGGQMIDLSPDRDQLDLAGVTELQALKTGALIMESCRAGALLGQAGQAEIDAVVHYAKDLGLAFQVVDDLLDHEGDAAQLGKPAGRDAEQGKATFVGLLGLAAARQKAVELVDSAQARLDIFGQKADLLRATATFVLQRRS